MTVHRPAEMTGDGREDGADAVLRGLVEGDARALEWLRARCRGRASPRFSHWAWEWVEEDFLADLATQLLVTLRKPGFRFRNSAEAYVDIAIFNLCRTYFRRIARLRSRAPLEDDVPAPEPDGLSPVDRVAAALDLRKALGRLDPACRRLILGKYVDGLSLDELGSEAGVPAKTVRSRLHTCRERLRDIWRRITAPFDSLQHGLRETLSPSGSTGQGMEDDRRDA